MALRDAIVILDDIPASRQIAHCELSILTTLKFRLSQPVQAMQDKVQALVRLSEAERRHQRSSNQLETFKKQNQDLTLRLREATQEKVNALMRVAADGNSSQATAAAGKGMPSPQKGSTWKVG